MNFLDPLFEKIPIIRDMDKKKRILAAGLVIFAVVSILGILIDAIAEAGGVIALISVAIGFLLMAAIIIADFILSRRTPPQPQQEETYSFFDDSADEFAYQDESYGYHANDGPSEDGFDNADFGDEAYEDDNRFAVDFSDDPADDYRDQEIEYTTEPEPAQEEPPRRFGGVFHRGRSDEIPSAADQIRASGYGLPDSQPQTERFDDRSSFAFTPEPDAYADRSDFDRPARSFDGDAIGQPVMTFPNPSGRADEAVAMAAAAVAPHVVAPLPVPDVIGGPVMSIPFRGASAPAATQESYTPPVTAYTPPAAYPQAAPQPVKSADPLGSASPVQSARGKEIEQFFDNMSDDELLYSDCVEVWAADAKPAAIRLLKQVESLSDKKIADALGREAEYVNAMLDRIYYFTMLDSIKDNLELKKYNFSAMVKECLRRFSPFFMEKRIGLLWKGLDIDIVTDKRWLIFALTQVVFNAVEFTGLGGKIAISAKKEGSMIHLMVDDSGCGISDDDLPHIFMAGFMGDNVPNESGRRTGMGLFITRSVVEKLGGTVTAESTVDKGTRITIILPEKP